jgi:hypothetical protein
MENPQRVMNPTSEPDRSPTDGDATASSARRRYRWISFRCSSRADLMLDDTDLQRRVADVVRVPKRVKYVR